MAKRAASMAPLRQGTFRSLWTATLITNLGTLIQAVGAGWIMTTLTDSRGMVALVQASATLPVMMFSVFSGALADSVDRRKIMLIAQSLMLVVSAVLALVTFAGMLSPWLLLAFTFSVGCGTALNNPSWQASMGDIVPREDLAAAVALNAMGFNLMRSVGPAIGGFIVAVAGAAAAFTVNALSYIALIVVLLRWTPAETPKTLPREAIRPAIEAGLRYMVMSPDLMTVIFRGFLFGTSGVSVLALLPLVAGELVQGGALTYGVMLGFFGIGAIIGAILNSRLRAMFTNEALASGAFAGFALGALVLSFSRVTSLSCLILLLSGACWLVAMSLFNVAVQISTPRWVVGRAISLHQTAVFGGMALGSWIWGSIADGYGVDRALFISGGALAIGALFGRVSRLPDTAALDLTPHGQFHPPALQLDIAGRSGPILVMVEYDIAHEDIDEFLAVMTNRRRIRMRDGAHRWTLLRDLEKPHIWAESYHVPTWVEYLRHHDRRTKADAENFELLQALHRGPAAVKVRRMIERQTVPKHDDMPLADHSEFH